MTEILPDSRLKDPKATVMVDWPITDEGGLNPRTIRLELEPIYCFNCGKPNGYVPRETMSFVSWLCDKCSEKWGQDAALHCHADQEFWNAVEHEMIQRFGHALTQEELWRLAEQDKLGRSLELLRRESPYKINDG